MRTSTNAKLAVSIWNEDAIGLYRGSGAAPMDEWTVYGLTGEGLAALATRVEDGKA